MEEVMAISKAKKKYGTSAQKAVKNELHRYKRGQAYSGKAGTPVKSRKQAVAIGLSKARKKGVKVSKISGTRKSSTRKSSSKKSTRY